MLREFNRLAQRMLCIDPKKRIKLEEIKTHIWFQGEIDGPDALMKEIERRKEKIKQYKEKRLEIEAQKETAAKKIYMDIEDVSFRGGPTRSCGDFEVL